MSTVLAGPPCVKLVKDNDELSGVTFPMFHEREERGGKNMACYDVHGGRNIRGVHVLGGTPCVKPMRYNAQTSLC